jgi:hypothetical protein
VNEPRHIAAHRHSWLHRAAIESSAHCGCFYCLAVYPPSAIREWVDGGETALCPRCGIDSVIGDASGYPLSGELLRAMKKHWF